MIRPATPLSILLLTAFGLLLISVLSVPIITAIPLCSFHGVTFGVFGLCTASGCSGIEVGYDAAAPFASDPQDFDLPAATRNNLTKLLVVHPVAAFLTLVMFILALVSHLHSASHSARYLLAMFVVSIFDFFICLLAFLVDVLIFVPHMSWGSYLVLAATIIVAFSGLVSCAMRRTVVNRKAGRKKVAMNAEMSGENYYAREAAVQKVPVPPQPTVPMVSGALGGSNQDSLPTFATFENGKRKDDQVSDERIPLTSRSPSDRSPNHVPADMATDAAYANPQRRSGSAPPQQRDQYGNIINDPAAAYGVRRGPSLDNVRGRGPPPAGYRGRGGYGPPGRGGAYGGYGPPPNGRGGYGQGGRGGYNAPPPNGRGAYGPPPRGGYGGYAARGGRGPPPGYAGPYDRRMSGDSYNGVGRRPSDPYGSNQSIPNPAGYEAYNPDRVSLPRAESPPPLPDENAGPVGQAVEMDATTGSPQHPPKGFGQFGQLRDSDADIAGMVGLQQGRTSTPQRHDTLISDGSGSRYSNADQYVPPRQNWQQGSNSPRVASPLNAGARPAELAARSPPPATATPPPAGTATSGTYYEDVDPRFADASATHRSAMPQPLQVSKSYEDIHNSGGAASPGAESDRSNFTSISQRGVNPRWNPPPPPMPMQYGQPMGPRRPMRPPQRDDVLLNNNPDFQLPGNRMGSPAARAQGPGPSGMIPGSAYPTNL